MVDFSNFENQESINELFYLANSIVNKDPEYECSDCYKCITNEHFLNSCNECLDHYEEMIYANQFRIE